MSFILCSLFTWIHVFVLLYWSIGKGLFETMWSSLSDSELCQIQIRSHQRSFTAWVHPKSWLQSGNDRVVHVQCNPPTLLLWLTCVCGRMWVILVWSEVRSAIRALMRCRDSNGLDWSALLWPDNSSLPVVPWAPLTSLHFYCTFPLLHFPIKSSPWSPDT